ncbi:MAG: TIGR01458 family HAD-type hydrolase [Methanoregula sp.]|jgi:HAD superfamily hydrolase (TIGR01458 family)|uniref:TIGR01458 family HAD-type hydrolase n=1 Tax=Methanoregula sp. TaxID=2052170 RepID=UPI0025E86413|nr:TIGR01458 family HAD-type hydrolase [Methanoregula sp.]MCK9631136.1 TIGR01458 family HAD-type hydrolase [Methanoregula sp.]
MKVKGLLIDIDGVLYVGDQPIQGGREAIEYLTENKYQFRFISNTTRKCRKTISGQLSAMGLDIPEESIFTPPRAAIAYMKSTGRDHFHLLTTGDVDQDFIDAGVRDDSEKTDFVIVGDAGEALTYRSLNTAFRLLIEGAELIALEKDRYWMTRNGLSLSAGPFVSALEFATGKQAIVMGKPSKSFFNLALRDMDLQPGEVAMIGDDIFTDVGGAQAAGITGILVRTGKFREDILQDSKVRPDAIIDSIARLQEIL